MGEHRRRGVAAVALAAALSMAAVGVAATGAAAQSSGSDPGITDSDVTLGYISSQTGVAAATHKNAHKSCEARVDAENAKGGVNGRKIKLEIIDDKSSPENLTAAKDLVQNRNVFAVIDNSAFAFLSYRFLRDAGVPMIGGGFDGSYYYDEGNENIVSALGNGTPVPGLTYDTSTRMMKQMGAKKVGAVGYGVSPSSSESAKATETFGAEAVGLKGVYLNNAVDFGTTDVGPIVLGIKNAGADGIYLPLDADTNFAIVQGLQQNGVQTKSNILATGYSQDLLDQPIAKTIKPNTVMFSGYRPVELGGPAVKQFQSNLKKYVGLTGVPDYGTYTGYIACDMAIMGLKNAGKSPTRQGFVDAIRKTNDGKYDGAGLLCSPLDLSYEAYGKVAPTSCTWFVTVKDGKFRVLNNGKPYTGKLVGNPDLIKKYEQNSGGVVTTAAPPSS
jgi:branched-chain amino acid transport system substrate-binding protein